MNTVDAAHLIGRLERVSRDAAHSAGLNAAQWEALRYLGRANRFSRHPAAVAEYFGSTRGTVSQTLMSLERKGYLRRIPSTTDRRSLRLELTPAGQQALDGDPLRILVDEIERGGQSDMLAQELRRILLALIQRKGGRPFGLCRSCRHFRRAPSSGDGRNHCALLDVPLTEHDAGSICIEQQPA